MYALGLGIDKSIPQKPVRCSNSTLHSSTLSSKYDHFLFQKTKMATANMPHLRLQNISLHNWKVTSSWLCPLLIRRIFKSRQMLYQTCKGFWQTRCYTIQDNLHQNVSHKWVVANRKLWKKEAVNIDRVKLTIQGNV